MRERLASTLAGAAVFFAAWAWFAGGSEWSLMLHPDEAKVAGWTRDAFEHGYVTQRVYPGGFFQVARAGAALSRAVSRAAPKWRAWTRQDGAVAATDASTFHPSAAAGAAPEASPFGVQAGRDLNAFLAALAALAVYLAARSLGCAAGPSLFAPAFLCAQRSVVEFSRYCETDVALVASLALAAWLFCRALAAPSAARAAAALFAAGFAVSCKYTLAPLAAWIPVAALAVAAEDRPRRGAARTAAFAAAFLLVFAAGFLLGTPALVRAPAWFRESAADVSRRTYAETAGLLGPFAATRWGGPALRLGSLLRECAAAGWGFWFAGAAGLAAWCARLPRRQLWGLPFFTALFLAWAVLGLPWFRTQELLPLAVAFAVFSAVAADACARCAVVESTP